MTPVRARIVAVGRSAKTIGLALPFSQRSVDGADAARFSDTLATMLDKVDELIGA